MIRRAILSKLCSAQVRGFASASTVPEKIADAISKLPSGSVVVQNDADSPVGREVVSLARTRGLVTINVIDDKPGSSDVIEQLKAEGADVVCTTSYASTWYIKRLMGDLPPPALGVCNASAGSKTAAANNLPLISVPGGSVLAVAKLVGQGGQLLTYGGQLPSGEEVEYAGAAKRKYTWGEYLKTKAVRSEAASL